MDYAQRAVAYHHLGNFKLAIDDYSEAIRLDPKHATLYYAQGDAEARRGNFDKAILDITEGIQLDPNNAVAYSLRGETRVRKGDFDKAIQDFSTSIQMNPKQGNVFYKRACVYQLTKEYEKALADFTEAVRLVPDQAPFQKRLADILARCPNKNCRDSNKAVAIATKACELTNYQCASYLDTLASAYAENRDFPQAIKWQKKALELGLNGKENVANARSRLKLYENGMPSSDAELKLEDPMDSEGSIDCWGHPIWMP
jgi:tetratricopeptide (TPR) repeat protein